MLRGCGPRVGKKTKKDNIITWPESSGACSSPRAAVGTEGNNKCKHPKVLLTDEMHVLQWWWRGWDPQVTCTLRSKLWPQGRSPPCCEQMMWSTWALISSLVKREDWTRVTFLQNVGQERHLEMGQEYSIKATFNPSWEMHLLFNYLSILQVSALFESFGLTLL